MDHPIKEVVILAGGRGTRLQSVVSDLPKPMASVGGRPFLSYLLDYCLQQKMEKVVLSVGYKYEMIRDYYGSSYGEMELSYVIEEEPLGTGGALIHALSVVEGESFLFLNGDSIFPVDVESMRQYGFVHRADMVLAIKKMQNFERYGTVNVECGRVAGFEEKKALKEGWIHAGVMVINKACLRQMTFPKIFSFEKDILEKLCGELRLMALESDAYFIDIGVPEDYARAQKELTALTAL